MVLGVFVCCLMFNPLFLFIFPSIVAYKRKHNNVIPILIINIIRGLSGIGYIISLAWGFYSNLNVMHKDRKFLKIYLIFILLLAAVLSLIGFLLVI